MILFTSNNYNKYRCLFSIIWRPPLSVCGSPVTGSVSLYNGPRSTNYSTLTMILSLLLSCLLLSPTLQADLDPNLGLTEEEFEDYFHVQPAEDPEEEERRAEALRRNEDYIRENNEKYEAGDITWFDKVNEFSNLPGYEAEAEKTGVADNVAEYGRGVVDDLMDVDPESERYFATFRSRRGLNLPESYNSVALDHVSPVKNQGGNSRLYTFL